MNFPTHWFRFPKACPGFSTRSGTLFLSGNRSSCLTFAVRQCIIETLKGGVLMTNFVQSVAPYILYTCSLVLLPLGINRFRAGSPVKGFLDFVGAGVIAVMAWSLANP